jgi:hypothetical protein
MKFLGYLYNQDETYPPPTPIEGKDALVAFIIEHLEEHQLIITDQGDRQVLLMRDGVDLFQDLDQFGINLVELMAKRRKNLVNEYGNQEEKPHWEQLYDQIGLSPGEIRMRQRVKAACKQAQTVADVAELVRGTYFDAFFYSEDGRNQWGYFDPEDLSVDILLQNGENLWQAPSQRIVLHKNARVRHQESHEDVHIFTLLDPP